MTLTLTKPRVRKEIEGLAICELMENHGWTSGKAMKAQNVPRSTFWDWVQGDPEFRARYEQARIGQAHVLAEEALDIADEDAWTMEAVQRNKLRADTRKWYTSKIAPKIFGDRVEHDHVHRHAVVILPALTQAPASLVSRDVPAIADVAEAELVPAATSANESADPNAPEDQGE